MDWEHGVVQDAGTTRGPSLERLEDWEVPPSCRVSAPCKNRWREGRIGVRESAGIGPSASAEGSMAAARRRSKRVIQLRLQEREARRREARGLQKMWRSETSTSFCTEYA
jgi:hypothetical protein